MNRDRTSSPLLRPANGSLRSAAGWGLACAMVWSSLAAAPAAAVAGPGPDVELPASQEEPLLVGTVTAERQPVVAAGVYAYRLADLTLRKVLTGMDGSFSFGQLPSGVYKVIAHKPGFLPAVTMLTRSRASAFQQIEFVLSSEDELSSDEVADFWSIRERIPVDVLREITFANAQPSEAQLTQLAAERIRAEIQAFTGSGDLLFADSTQLQGGEVDVAADLGSYQVALTGSFQDLQSAADLTGPSQNLGYANGLRLEAAAAERNSRLAVSSHQASLGVGVAGASFPGADRIGLERYGVQWMGDLAGGNSRVSADYVQEANYYQDPRLAALALPTGSSTLSVAGQFDRQLGSRSSLRTGVSYSSRTSEPFGRPTAVVGTDPFGEQERFELFGLGDLEFGSLMVEYGLYTTVNADQVTFTPHGGVVIDLGKSWQAGASVRQRVNDQDAWQVGFTPLYHGTTQECTSAEDACYRVHVRRGADGQEFEVAATVREFADVARVYFSDDFFQQFESLLFVPGDALPEVRLSLTRRLGNSVSARFESTLASGGGGVLEGRNPRQNDVRYVVTSMDTQFEATETGLLLAFHSLQQSLEALGTDAAALESYDMDRLQLLVKQSLGALFGAGLNWDVLLDMQLSRGADPFQVAEADEIRRRIVGGLALRF